MFNFFHMAILNFGNVLQDAVCDTGKLLSVHLKMIQSTTTFKIFKITHINSCVTSMDLLSYRIG